MVALAAAVSGDRSHAEDIAQEALRRASQRWTALSGYDKPGAWVRRVTVNLSISRKRRVVAEAKALLRLGPTEDSLGDPPPDHRRVWEAVAELSPKQRSVVSLHYLEDMALNEIARVLDMAESTVRVHLHRARARLAELLGGPFAVGES